MIEKGIFLGQKRLLKKYIKLPMYLLFNVAGKVEIIIFMRGNPKLGPFEGVGNENLDF